ncbi:hypothetical protein [Actinomadura harenae]|uniref:Holliday junction resolvase n=1 Tax=Actinomadura harenae TaxID=2483351 RepID=A0A3M2LRI9_9ACTN|nr:hypothetical protein [Actinomadura harenae]RMI39902.1 hypothetical protein EBO15_28465 [Actinomadura harenae]
MNKPKQRGTAAETAVVRYLRGHGWPSAERRALRGRDDAGDITGTPGIAWEVKGGDMARNASDNDIARWMVETEVERANARAAVGVLVVQRRGVGAPNAGRWWAVLPANSPLLRGGPVDHDCPVRLVLADAVTLARHAGFGDSAEVPA